MWAALGEGPPTAHFRLRTGAGVDVSQGQSLGHVRSRQGERATGEGGAGAVHAGKRDERAGGGVGEAFVVAVCHVATLPRDGCLHDAVRTSLQVRSAAPTALLQIAVEPFEQELEALHAVNRVSRP